MVNSAAPSSSRVLAELREPLVQLQVLRIARRITGSWVDGKDLVQDALVRVLDPDDLPWKGGSFLSHMAFVTRHVWGRQQRRARAKREIADEDVTLGKKGFSREPPADEELDRRRSLAVLQHLGAQLLEALGDKDPLAMEVFKLGAAGIESPAQQAEVLKKDVAEIYAARKTIKGHAERIGNEWTLAEEARMKELRSARPRMPREPAS